MIDSSKFPQVKDLKTLKVGDSVYSEKYGLGNVTRFYGKEVVVSFSNYSRRFSVEEHELKEAPREWLKKTSKRVQITVNGQKLTLRKFKAQIKSRKKLERILQKTI